MFSFSKELYSWLHLAVTSWEYKFAALSAAPMIAHFLFRVCGALYRRAVGHIPSTPTPSAVATTHVVICLKCGQKNRVPDRFGTAKCANCKEVIEVNLRRSWLETLRWPLRAPAFSWASVWALAMVLAIMIEVNKPESPRATTLQPSAPAFPPQSKSALNPVEASTGFFSAPVGPRLAPITIRTRGPYNFFVRLYDQANNIAAEIYIRGGDTFFDKMTLGSYTLRYASGTTWYGRAARFGEGTSYNKTLDVFEFRGTSDGYEGYTIDLYRQPHGNLATTSISENEFGE